MAEVIWSESALAELDAIADYIAIEHPAAAQRLVTRVFQHVAQLADHPQSGTKPSELGEQNRYRQFIEPPCRIFYRHDAEQVFIVHVMRAERLLRKEALDE